jgi:hypothetical protein
MTPCEELGYRKGDRFVVKAGYYNNNYGAGDVVVLDWDDSTRSPFFRNEVTGKADI